MISGTTTNKPMVSMRGRRLGEILIALGVIDETQLRSAAGYQRQWGYPLGQCLIELRICDEETITKALSLQLGIPYVRLRQVRIPESTVRLIPARVARQARAIPLAILKNPKTNKQVLQVAMSNPRNLDAIDALRFAANMEIVPVLAADSEIDLAIDHLYEGGWQQLTRETVI